MRVATVKGKNRKHSGILTVGLAPQRPVVTASATAQGVSLRWVDLPVGGYEITRALDPAFTTGRVTDWHRGRTRQFTPYGLMAGTRYWFRVRALNGATRSAWSSAVSATPQTGEARIRVVAYNLLGMWADGERGDFGKGEVVKPWMTSRRPAAAALVRPVTPDIVLVQEASSWTAGWASPWQVDTFASTLGSDYRVARTQGRAGEPDYIRTGNHVVYRASVFDAVGNGGHWSLGNGRYAAWQLLRHKATGAELLAVSTHNTSLAGASYDVKRRAEFDRLLSLVTHYRSTRGPVPVVYGGDVGSVRARWHPYDPPGVVIRGSGGVDTIEAAQRVTNAKYSSYNHYTRVPKQATGSGDRIFVSAGVGVRAWAQLLRLSSGKFVGTIPSDHNPVLADITVPYDVS